eukprot:7562990-Pyramimonas_sp.AAC.1
MTKNADGFGILWGLLWSPWGRFWSPRPDPPQGPGQNALWTGPELSRACPSSGGRFPNMQQIVGGR